jgi:hypothetical protein
MHYWDQMLHAFLAWSNSPRDDLGGSSVAFLYLLALVNVPGGDGGESISLFCPWFLDPLPNHSSLSLYEKA